MRDLQDPTWMYVKAALLLCIVVMSSALLLAESPGWRTSVLIALVIWGSARIYYFAFYVIERYIDPSYRFSGLLSAIGYLNRRRSPPDQASDREPRG